MLKIVPTTDPLPVDRLVVTIYGQPGVGKTSLGFTAHRPLLLDFDAGAYRAANRGDTVQIKRWSDIATIDASEVSGYETVVVDTVGRALDCLSAWIIDNDPRMGREGALTLQGFGALKARFTTWTRALLALHTDVVLLAHADEQQRGDDMLERLDIQGGSKREIYKLSDAMGRLYMHGGKRVLNFSPSDTAFGKNPGMLDAQMFVSQSPSDLFLGKLIDATRDKLNEITEAQLKSARELEDWKKLVGSYKSASDFNGAMGAIKDAPLEARRAFVQASRDAGLVFDAELRCYVQQHSETTDEDTASVPGE